jgi:hypothetical protein
MLGIIIIIIIIIIIYDVYLCVPSKPTSSQPNSLTHFPYPFTLLWKNNLIVYMFQAYDDELNMKGHNFEISHK